MDKFIPSTLLENAAVYSRIAPALAALYSAAGEAQAQSQVTRDINEGIAPTEEQKNDYNNQLQELQRSDPSYQQSLEDYMQQVRDTQRVIRAVPRAPQPGGPPPESPIAQAVQEVNDQPPQEDYDEEDPLLGFRGQLPPLVDEIPPERVEEIERAAARVSSLGDEAVQFVVRFLLYAAAHGDSLYQTAATIATSYEIVKKMLANYHEQEIADRDDVGAQDEPIEVVLSRPTPPQCVRHVYYDP